MLRDRHNLDDFLYETNTQYSNREAMKVTHTNTHKKTYSYLTIWISCSLTESLIRIFLGLRTVLRLVDFTSLTDSGVQFALLFKMCKKTNKILFAAGLGMQLLVYYCSTTFPDVNVINPKGDRLDIINTISKDQTRKFRRTDVFLDSCTGDYYGFN